MDFRYSVYGYDTVLCILIFLTFLNAAISRYFVLGVWINKRIFLLNDLSSFQIQQKKHSISLTSVATNVVLHLLFVLSWATESSLSGYF